MIFPLSSDTKLSGIGSFHGAKFSIILLFLLSQLLIGCNREPDFNGVVYDPPIVAPALNGVDQTGSPFNLEELHGKVLLLYFGYTKCPDICPLTMGQIATIYRQLGAKAENLQVVFVSTDPERDTPEQIANYIQLFDASFLGVQIPAADLAGVLKTYGGLAEKDPLPEGKSKDQYTVTHSNWIYAIDSAGKLRLLFSSQLQAQQIVDDLLYLLNE